MPRALPRRALLALALLAGPFLALRLHAEESADPWRDEALVGRRFAEACAAVEEVVGVRFRARPEVRLSEPDVAVRLLREDLEGVPEEILMGLPPEAVAEALGRAYMAKYDAATHVVHVFPDNVSSLAELHGATAGEDHLRVLLAHEATHALDFERFPLQERHASLRTADAFRAFQAVTEGHAQWVARRAAATWELTAAFDTVTTWIVDLPEEMRTAGGPQMQATQAWIAFPYAQGLTFVEAVHAAKGREGVDAALRDPPTSTRVIEAPERWLGPEAEAGEPDLEALLQGMRPLVGDPAFQVVTQRVPEVVLRSQAAAVPEARREEFLRGFQDARLLLATVPGEPVLVVVMALLFERPEDARLMVELERVTTEAKDAQGTVQGVRIESSEYEDGAGPGGRLPGYFARKEARVLALDLAQRVDMQAFSRDRVAVLLTVAGVPSLDRAAQDAVLAWADAHLRDPAEAAALPPVPSPRLETAPVESLRLGRRLEIRVEDSEGRPVPSARVAVVASGRRTEGRLEAPSLTLTLTVAQGPARVAVWEATDMEDEPLPLAPVSRVLVEPDQESVVVRLAPGVVIEGRLRDPEGEPVRHASIVAKPHEGWREPEVPPGVVHGVATTDEEGRFRIVGLAHIVYELEARQADQLLTLRPSLIEGGMTEAEIGVIPGSR